MKEVMSSLADKDNDCASRTLSPANSIYHVPLTDSQMMRSMELIGDLAACVQQLVENSVDAGASWIEIRADYSKCSMSVADNGSGFSACGIDIVGASRYASSKKMSHNDYGFRGEALHSISSLGILEIQTRPSGEHLTTTKIINCGMTLSTTVDSSREVHGTTVTVRDLFHDWPVRKHAMRRHHQLARMKDILHRLALINYSITWTLIDAEKSKLLWHAPAAQSFNCRIRSLYGLSSFELKPISRQYDSFQIDGSIGVILRGATKPIAEIYVNKRSIPPTSDLVRCLTTITPETLSVLARETKVHLQASYCPSFVLHVKCSPDTCDTLSDPDKSTVLFKDISIIKTILYSIFYDEVLSNTEACTSGFAKALRILLEDKKPRKRNCVEVVDQVRQHIDTTMKMMRPDEEILNVHLPDSATQVMNLCNMAPASDFPSPFYGPYEEDSFLQVDEPFIDETSIPEKQSERPFEEVFFLDNEYESPDKTATLSVTVVRNVGPFEPISSKANVRESFGSAFFGEGTPLKIPFLPAVDQESVHNLLPESTAFDEVRVEPFEADKPREVESLLCPDLNPNDLSSAVSVAVEVVENIKTEIISSEIIPQSNSWSEEHVDIGRFRLETKPAFIANTSGSFIRTEPVQITKQLLREASTIGQASSSFILALAGKTLLCIDQHAADERVHLETFEEEFYGHLGQAQNKVELEVPAIVQFSEHERPLFSVHRASLEALGFGFSSDDSDTDVTLNYVPFVHGIMLTVSDLKVILYQMNKFDPSAAGIQVKPSTVQSILCSKACRTAIMFGDNLSFSESATLLENLSKCKLPFQCAHGRPSSAILVPNLKVIFERHSANKESKFNKHDCRKLNLSRFIV